MFPTIPADVKNYFSPSYRSKFRKLNSNYRINNNVLQATKKRGSMAEKKAPGKKVMTRSSCKVNKEAEKGEWMKKMGKNFRKI